MKMEYRTEGTCSRRIFLELDGDIIRSVSFEGGCNGNLKGIGSLVAGMNRDEAITRLKDIRCGFKATSCPDQLAKALEESKRKQ